MTLEFTAPIRIESANVTRDRHWAIRKRKTDVQREAVRYSALAAGWMVRAVAGTLPKPPMTIVITRIAPRLLDDDNATAGAKAIRDEIARLLSIDDGDPRVTWRVEQRKGKPKEFAVHVLIAAISSTV